ncbi:MAG: prephenate dehydrogenase/arogenate dehydrogenase family protein [Burkholderiales bacterium]|jgi:prephenate dehydrogenase|nr:prephenate dehydrogenase/arogenate dehydrogenase family protein [Burkholderiales bacterium]
MPANKHNNKRINKLVVIGVGLIGGSFALALKKARMVKQVVGVGRSRKNLQLALKRGVIDKAETDVARAVADADLVLVGAPVGQMPGIFARIAPALPKHAVVTDAGSTKQDVIAAARRHLGAHFAQFVSAHPIAGTEHSGAGAAFSELFRDRNLILLPQKETKAAAVRLVREAWLACGARIVRLEAAEHDEIFGAVSHLPHVVAFALVNLLAQRRDAKRLLGFSGGGLRDTVRIAGSSPEMWRDICIANRAALVPLVDGYISELEAARAALAAGDGESLEHMFSAAQKARAKWLIKPG